MAAPSEDDGTIKRLRDVLKRIRDASPLIDSDPDAFQKAVGEVAERLQAATGAAGEIELHVSTNRITYNDDEVFKSEARTNNLAFDIFRQGLRRLNFKPGLTADEVHAFLVAFSENRSADQIDEDFVSTLWRESLPNITYIAIDGFTDKIFMSEERFTGAFRGVIDDLMPGLVDLIPEDPGDDGPRERVTVDEARAAERADIEERKLRKRLPDRTRGVIEALRVDGLLDAPLERVVELLARLIVKPHSPLDDGDMHRVVVRVLAAWLENQSWQAFADAVRSLRVLVEAHEAFPAIADRLDRLGDTIAGRDLAAQVAHHLDPENTDFTAWARWHFATSSALTAPELLELIDACQNPSGAAFLKDLLRRQGTESLDPWAERLRDPNPGVVLEVIDVIVGSDLSEQARPLLMDTMKHAAPEVRAAAAEGLAGAYDLAVREALLPFLKDPSAVVRRAVVNRFLAAGDKSVSPYLASTIKADIFPGFDEDEQRLYFETLARLGGARFLSVFEQALGLEEQNADLLSRFFKRGSSALIDNPTRRGAVSGLAILGTREAVALIRKAHARADLGLAAHCDVVLRLAARGEAASEAPADVLPPKARALEDVDVGRALLGERVLFTLDSLSGPGPEVPRPAGAPPDDAPPARPVEPSAAPAPSAGAVVEASRPPSTAPTPSGPPPLELGDRPLLNATERYLPTDVMTLEVDLAAFDDAAYQLIEATVELTGQDAPVQRRRRRSVSPGRVPGRIVEKRAAAPVYTDWSEKPESKLDDIIAGYLGKAVDAAEPTRPAVPSVPVMRPPVAEPRSEDDFRKLLDLDAITHHEIEAHPSASQPSFERGPETDPSIVAPSSGGDRRESVEALLKDYLTLGYDGDASAAEPEESLDVAPEAPVEELPESAYAAAESLEELPESAYMDAGAESIEELDPDDFEELDPDDFEELDAQPSTEEQGDGSPTAEVKESDAPGRDDSDGKGPDAQAVEDLLKDFLVGFGES